MLNFKNIFCSNVNREFNRHLNKNLLNFQLYNFAKKKEKEEDKMSLFQELELRVGRVVEINNMENSEDIYCLKVDLGNGIREIGSGLRRFLPHSEFINKNVVVFYNLKPKKLGLFVSNGMILASSNEQKTVYELLRPQENTHPGENIYLDDDTPNPESLPNINDRKLKKALSFFKTDENCFATFNGAKLRTEGGYITVKSLNNTSYS